MGREKHFDFLSQIVERLKERGIRTSIFVNPDDNAIRLAAKAGADRVELYTEPYATMYPDDPEGAIAPFVQSAVTAHKAGLGVTPAATSAWRISSSSMSACHTSTRCR